MGKFNKHQGDRGKFGKCSICLEFIPIEYYFRTGDTIVCYECGTEYILTSKEPIQLAMLDSGRDPDDYYGDMIFED